jgi:hypothetical protein
VKRFLLTFLLGTLATTAHAGTISIDFETTAIGRYDGNVGLTFTDAVTGVQATLTRSGSYIDIIATEGALPGFGSRTLSPFDNVNDPTPYVWFFTPGATESVYRAEFDAGDFTPSDTDKFTVTTVRNGGTSFSNSGTLDGMQAPGWSKAGLVVQANAGILGLIFTGGSVGAESSLYWDNFKFITGDSDVLFAAQDLPMGDFTGGGAGSAPGVGTGQEPAPVPEPGTLGLLGVALGTFLFFRRQR